MSLIMAEIIIDQAEEHETFDKVCKALQTFQYHDPFAITSERNGSELTLIAIPGDDSMHRIGFIITEEWEGKVSIAQTRYWSDGHSKESYYEVQFAEVIPIIEMALSCIINR